MKKYQFIIISSMLIIIICLFVYYLHYQTVKDKKAAAEDEEERIVLLEEKIEPIRKEILGKLILETILANTYFRINNTYADYVLYKNKENLDYQGCILERADKDSIIIRIISTSINPRNKKLIEYLAKVGHGNSPEINKIN